MTETDLPGLPAAPIRRWISRNVPDVDLTGPWAPEVISGGLSNITCRLRLPCGNLILRRPPLGPLLPRAHDVAREYRVLRALAPTAVPVPEPLGLCTDPDVIGAPFYVTPEVSRDVLRTAQATAELSLSERATLGRELASVLAALHALDPDAVGLVDYGRREGYCRRQIVTWGAQWSDRAGESYPRRTCCLLPLPNASRRTAGQASCTAITAWTTPSSIAAPDCTSPPCWTGSSPPSATRWLTSA